MKQLPEKTLRIELVEICRQLETKGLIKGTAGNVSVRTEGGFLVSPTGIPYASLTADQIVKMSWSGTFEGTVLPSSEWRFHRDILVNRDDLNAVVHTHSPYATAISVLERGIPAIHYRIGALGGFDIRCAPYATFGTQALADVAVVAMEGRRGCLLSHHGAIGAHATLKGALLMAEVIEELAQLYLFCLPMGPPPILAAEEIARVIEKHKTYGQQTNAAMESSSCCDIRNGG